MVMKFDPNRFRDMLKIPDGIGIVNTMNGGGGLGKPTDIGGIPRPQVPTGTGITGAKIGTPTDIGQAGFRPPTPVQPKIAFPLQPRQFDTGGLNGINIIPPKVTPTDIGNPGSMPRQPITGGSVVPPIAIGRPTDIGHVGFKPFFRDNGSQISNLLINSPYFKQLMAQLRR